MNVDAISPAAVYPDLLPWGVIKSVYPDVGSRRVSDWIRRTLRRRCWTSEA